MGRYEMRELNNGTSYMLDCRVRFPEKNPRPHQIIGRRNPCSEYREVFPGVKALGSYADLSLPSCIAVDRSTDVVKP
jgi:hypothetical protein